MTTFFYAGDGCALADFEPKVKIIKLKWAPASTVYINVILSVCYEAKNVAILSLRTRPLNLLSKIVFAFSNFNDYFTN